MPGAHEDVDRRDGIVRWGSRGEQHLAPELAHPELQGKAAPGEPGQEMGHRRSRHEEGLLEFQSTFFTTLIT